MARIIPVIDVLDGRVVRAVGGRRSEYRPIRSRLTDSTDPVEVADALTRAARTQELYVADLDTITGGQAGSKAVSALCSQGWTVWLDAGVRTPDDLDHLPASPTVIPILAMETMQEPKAFVTWCRFRRQRRVALSIDLQSGLPVREWPNCGIWEAPALAVDDFSDAGCEDVILLDLADVGQGRGPSTTELCADLKSEWPDVRFVVGGGVRGWSDVTELEARGADAVLVASALHDGTLTFPRPPG